MIVVSIDVTKLDKARFKEGKNGAKYCEFVLIDHPRDKSDGFVKQGVSKEEREARVEMPIIGNFKIIGSKPQKRQESAPPRRPASPPPARPDPDIDQPSDEIPFARQRQKRRSNLL